MMRQGLQLRTSQQLTMTPQLQQAIRLLQLSSIELQSEVQEALDSNVMLELDEPDTDVTEPPTEGTLKESTLEKDAADVVETPEPSVSEELPDDLPMDCGWDAIYDGPARTKSTGGDDATQLIERLGSSQNSLQDHLLEQLRLENLSPMDYLIAETLIDSIDDHGYLTDSLELFHTLLNLEVETNGHGEITLAEITAVFHRIQHCEPAGVGARNLSECLAIQLRRNTHPQAELALALVEGYLDVLASLDPKQLAKKLTASVEDINAAIALIQRLNPRPGAGIGSERIEYIVPDVFVRRHRGQWCVFLNEGVTPPLRVNQYYAQLSRQYGGSKDGDMLKNHLQEARWLIKSLESRNETLLKVANCIVAHQGAFFDDGDEALKPLILREIADQVEMHESTISRVTSSKYMHTPRGVFAFKHFFSSHVSTTDGGEASATAIQAIIRKLVSAENPRKPLSDNRLMTDLQNRGINIARRTVAKYRETLDIPPSHARKRLA